MLRKMTVEDVLRVFAIEQAVQAYPWTLGNFNDALNSGYLCYVDETDEDGIRGYAIVSAAAGEAELFNIGIKAAHQRKGLGRSLLQEIFHQIKDAQVSRVFLEVRASNHAAIALYRKVGFNEIGLRRNYYRNMDGSEDAITMSYELTEIFSDPDGTIESVGL
jgi:ribosomal-protein-alanine N-acetyltransferase